MTIFIFSTNNYCWCVIIDYIFSDACVEQWLNFQLTVALPFNVLSQCIVYWTHFHNIQIYFYISKNITSYLFSLVLKIDESLHCILKEKYNFTSYQKTWFHIDYQSISIDQNNIFSNILYICHKMGSDLDLFLVYFMIS